MHRVHSLDGFALGFRRPQLVVGVDTPDNQDSAIHFNFTGNF
jgi:hypothetical protein